MRTKYEFIVDRDDNNKIVSRSAVIYVMGSKKESEDDVFAYALKIKEYFENESWFKPSVDFYDKDDNSVMVLFGEVETTDRIEIKEYLSEFKQSLKNNIEVVKDVASETTTTEVVDEEETACDITIEDVRNYATYKAKMLWNLDLDIPIEINGRLKIALGRYVIRNGEPHRIELSKDLFRLYSPRILQETVLHELCHWAYHVMGLPYHDNEEAFELELIRIGSHSSGTVALRGSYYVALCSTCGKLQRRFTTKAGCTRYITKRVISKCCGDRMVAKSLDR